MIVNLSSPPSASVNDGIPKGIWYASIDDAIWLIRQMGPRCQLVKMDLKDAYRMVPVHPEDQHLLTISWEGQTYVDQALPFGLRSAPKIFSAVADAIAWVLFFQGGIHFLHYLDDFLFFGVPGTDEAASAQDRALFMFQDLDVPIAMHKTEGPTTSLTFLGIVIDTELLQLRLPEEKLGCVRELVCSWLPRSCRRKEFESPLGHLSHAAVMIRLASFIFVSSLPCSLQLQNLPIRHLCNYINHVLSIIKYTVCKIY